ncbi:hypothetical protein FDO65_04575 [Nakamurella flava]|uniref:Fibronectin type III domain-containing protein n=1 Tax=Nakamurella flava TaxID=2576308 RepID=A0A4U6QKB0_9ACTN|nr:fibronectin type III domain-containing protein [Nakamurella flava]TKV60937.1 hypothetical protein FDO65_04575 [Nakamurella flava]
MNDDRRYRRHGTVRSPGRRIAALAAAAALAAGVTVALPGAAAAAPAALVGLSTKVFGLATDTTAAGSPLAYDVATTVGGETPTGRITTTLTTPTGVRLLGAAGTGWACSAARLQAVSCVSNQVPDAGAVLGDLTITAVTTTPVASTAIAGATIQATDGTQTVTAPTATTAATPSAPTVTSVEPAIGPRAGHTPLTITGTGLATATAVQIGTTSQLAAGTGTTLVKCDTIAAPQCFTEKDGVLSISSMPVGGGDVAIRVLARNAFGAGSYRYADIPDAPVVTATPTTEGVDLTWTTPAAGTTSLTGYTVTATRDGAAVGALTRTLPPGTTTTQFTGLAVGSVYQFAVRADSANGSSQPGTSATAAPFTVPTEPFAVNAQPGETLGDGVVELSWFAPTDDGSSPVTGYRITPIRDGVEQAPVDRDAYDTRQLVTGLDVGHTYEFSVAALNAAGSSSRSAPSPALDIPAASTSSGAVPDLLALTPPAGQTSSTYSWQPRVVGGRAPYTWTLAGGALPGGLTLAADRGTIRGTPAVAGTFAATIQVQDADGGTSRMSVTIPVRDSVLTTLRPVSHMTFGTATTLTADVTSVDGGAITTGFVRFYGADDSGTVVVLGNAPVTNGTATITAILPNFGLWTLRTGYLDPGSTAASETGAINVNVAPVIGSVAFTGFRASGPNGSTDQYVELTNLSGVPVPLGELTVYAAPGSMIPLPDTTLLPGRSFLLAGPGYTPTTNSTPDLVFADGLGTGDLVLVNLYSQTYIDSVGPDGFGLMRPGPLPDLGQPTRDYAWVRPQQNGFYRNTGDNTVDFALLSADGNPVSGVTAMAGSASPQSSTSPWFHAGDLESTLLNPLASESVTPNRTITTQGGQPGGTIVSRRVITNRTAQTMDKVQLRLIDLSQANGLPGLTLPNGATTAALRGIAPPTPTANFTINGQPVTAQQLTPSGSGLNAVYPVPLPQDGLAPGQSVAVTLTFQADTGGQFRFRYLAEGQPAS